MKIHTYLIHATGEYYAKTTEPKLYRYLVKWHLSESEADILFETGSYLHDTLGLITYTPIDLD